LNIYRVNVTYLWLKLAVAATLLMAVPLLFFWIPPWELWSVRVSFALAVAGMLFLNAQLKHHRVQWHWLLLALLLPVIGWLMAYRALQKAVATANEEHCYAP